MKTSSRARGIRRRALIAGGLAALMLAALWMPYGVPVLQKMPKSINETVRYQGTFTTQLDASGATLAAPVVTPLNIERHIQSLAAQSGARRVMVQETMRIAIGEKRQTMVSTYLIDRRTMQNVPDSRTVVRQNGTYSINLPFGTATDHTYRMWRAETGTSYPLAPATGPKTTETDGLRLLRLTGTMATTPVTDKQRAALAVQGLPMALSSTEMAARMTAVGIDVSAIGPVLGRVLTPKELVQVLYAFSAWVPLRYELANRGQALVEPRTGMIVSVANVTENLTAKPDLAAAAPTLALLRRHADVPEINALLTKLDAAAAAPGLQVYSLRYSQTPASVGSQIDKAKAAAGALGIVRQVVPLSLALAGFVLLLLGSGLGRNRKQTSKRTRPIFIGPLVPASPKTA